MVFEVASLRLEELIDAAAAFETSQAPALTSADIYYRRASDVALLALQYPQTALTGHAMHWLVETCKRLGASIIDPSRMNEFDRRSFYQSYLHHYETKLDDLATARVALGALLNRLSGASELIEVSDSAIVESGANADKLDDLDPISEPVPHPSLLSPMAARAYGGPPSTIVTMPNSIVHATPQPTDRLTPQQLGALLPPRHEGPPAEIDVRFVRGGAWISARLRALSLRGAYLVTGAPPRVGDTVDIVLSYGEAGALVRGAVYHVTTANDTQAGGSVGFAVRFPMDPSPTRSQLIALLTKARAAGVTIKPPPTRSSVRFPVCWPISLTSTDQAQALLPHPLDATDVSAAGMFLATSEALAAQEFAFSIAVDEPHLPPITGVARVVRHIALAEARQRSIREGYGAEIVAMSDRNARHWAEFLSRIQRRTERRLLVGAAATRLDEIVGGLTAAGYSVTAGSDPGTLVRLAEAEARPPDAAIIDVSISVQGPGQWLEHVFAARNVPCVTVRGDAKRTRLVVDQLLGVSA